MHAFFKTRQVGSEFRPIAACAAANCLAYLTWWFQPYIVRELIDSYHISPSRAGLVLSVEFIATALTALGLARVVASISFRTIALAASVVALLGASLSMAVRAYEVLMFARIVTGMGEGAVLMVSMSVLARMTSPDRAYAKVLLINCLFGIAISFLMQSIGEWTHSPSVVFPLMLLLLLGLSSILLVLPKSFRANGARAVAASTIGHASSARVLVLTVAVMTVAACDNMVWSFFFPFGQHAGMNAEAVNRSLELAVLVSALGAAIPTILGARYGRLRPLALGLFVQMAAIVLMYRSSNSVWFSVAANFYLVGGFLAVPYYFGFAAAEDPSGRAAAIVGGSYTLAGAMSPLLGGVVIERFGLQFVPWVVIGANCFAVSVFWWLDRNLQPRARATDGRGVRV